jgi:very-short-patch-repair endonuclease
VPTGFHHRPAKAVTRKNAKRLRRNGTDAENKMWQLLRGRRLEQFKFRRQTPIEGYILDFVCFERKVAIEVDGSQHFSQSKMPAGMRRLDAKAFGYYAIGITMCCNVRMPFLRTSSLTLKVAGPDPSPGARRAPPSPARGEGELLHSSALP